MKGYVYNAEFRSDYDKVWLESSQIGMRTVIRSPGSLLRLLLTTVLAGPHRHTTAEAQPPKAVAPCGIAYGQRDPGSRFHTVPG